MVPNVRLTADLDMTGITLPTIGKPSDNTYEGNFDGQGHTISNLTVTGDGVQGNQTGIGLFKRKTKGTITRTILRDITINVTVDDEHPCDYAGGFVGNQRGSSVLSYCAVLGLKVIPAEAEAAAIRRDISLCRETGCRLHVQHISTADGVALVRAAQREGLSVTAEATPHHLVFACDELEADDANYKMAPPLGNREDRAELRRAVKDGVLMFATDHAPHTAEAKVGGFAAAANGIIGLETAAAATYAVMVEGEGMAVDAWARAWHDLPLSLLPRVLAEQVTAQSRFEVGAPRPVDIASFASRSRNCPWNGMEFSLHLS